MHAPLELADIVADLFARIRSRAPRVHCITNSVAQQYTANMLLAAGAVPSMTLSPDEIGGFVAGADALLVNLGTFDAERKSAIGAALLPRPSTACLGCSIRSSSSVRPGARSSRAISSAAVPRLCGSMARNSRR